MLSTDDIARRLGVSRPTASKLVRSGEIAAERVGGQWVSTERAFDA